MTTRDAAQAWGVSVTRVNEYCMRGMVPGARKIMRPGWSHARWDIPDLAKKPRVRRGRPSLSNEISWEPYEDEPIMAAVEAEMPDPTGVPPALYVWQNQDQTIKRIAEALKTTSARVIALYDLAMGKYMA